MVRTFALKCLYLMSKSIAASYSVLKRRLNPNPEAMSLQAVTLVFDSGNEAKSGDGVAIAVKSVRQFLARDLSYTEGFRIASITVRAGVVVKVRRPHSNGLIDALGWIEAGAIVEIVAFNETTMPLRFTAVMSSAV